MPSVFEKYWSEKATKVAMADLDPVKRKILGPLIELMHSAKFANNSPISNSIHEIYQIVNRYVNKMGENPYQKEPESLEAITDSAVDSLVEKMKFLKEYQSTMRSVVISFIQYVKDGIYGNRRVSLSEETITKLEDLKSSLGIPKEVATLRQKAASSVQYHEVQSI